MTFCTLLRKHIVGQITYIFKNAMAYVITVYWLCSLVSVESYNKKCRYVLYKIHYYLANHVLDV